MRDTPSGTRTVPAGRFQEPAGSHLLQADALRGSSSALKIVVNFALVYVLWGSTYLAIKVGVKAFSPAGVIGLRFLLAGAVMLLGWCLWSSRRWPTLRELLWAVVLGVMMLIGGTGLVAYAVRHVDSGVAAMVVATTPMWFAVFDRLLGGPGIRPAQIVGIAIGMAGTWVLVQDKLRAPGPSQVPGLAALFAAVIFWTSAGVLSKRVRMPRNLYLTSGIEMLAAGLVAMMLGLVRNEYRPSDLLALPAAAWGAIIYLVIFGSCLGFTAYAWLLAHQPTSRVSTYAFVNPIVAVLLGWWLGGEPLTWNVLLSLLLIAGGVALMLLFAAGPSASLASAPQQANQAGRPANQQADQQQEQQAGHGEAEDGPALGDQVAAGGPALSDQGGEDAQQEDGAERAPQAAR